LGFDREPIGEHSRDLRDPPGILPKALWEVESRPLEIVETICDCPKRSHFTPNVCLFLDSHRKTKKTKNLIPTPRSSLLMIIVIVVVVVVGVSVIVIVIVIAPDSGQICEDD
jgi:hypothetical protein